jgi:hypothetical protein
VSTFKAAPKKDLDHPEVLASIFRCWATRTRAYAKHTHSCLNGVLVSESKFEWTWAVHLESAHTSRNSKGQFHSLVMNYCRICPMVAISPLFVFILFLTWRDFYFPGSTTTSFIIGSRPWMRRECLGSVSIQSSHNLFVNTSPPFLSSSNVTHLFGNTHYRHNINMHVYRDHIPQII